MKQFSEYQKLEGEPMTERDKKEIDSKYWNEGKLYNFVLPFISTDESLEEKTFIDIGCNAGLFLQFAKDFGFGKVIGVEADKETYDRAVNYRDKHNLDYKLINSKFGDCIDKLPVSDFIVFANVHYYFTPTEWNEYINKLKNKTIYIIIVTAEKKPNIKYAPSDLESIRKDLKDWQEIDVIDIPKDDTPYSRHLTSIYFKNNLLNRVEIDSLDNGNNQQRDFLKQLDEGINPLETNYYRRLKSYRRHTGSKQEIWSIDKLTKYMQDRVSLYEDIKKNGIMEAIVVKLKNNRITDGNHRHNIAKHLGYRNILIKYE